MTTTADTILLTEKDKQRLEKIIEVSKAALEGQEIECFEYDGANKSWHQANCVCWNWRDYDYRIKPPDPKPLEHINELRRRQSAAEDEIQKLGEAFGLLRSPELKATDPETFECWAAVYSDRSVKCFVDSKEAAQLLSPPENSPVHMREVTPQMEQNELDAKRYRWWKHHFPVPNSDFGDPGEWDDIADKAMGE